MSVMPNTGFVQSETFLKKAASNGHKGHGTGGHVKRLQLVCQPEYEGVILVFGNALWYSWFVNFVFFGKKFN